MKKEISYKWQQSNNKPIVITGLRKEEGGARKMISCLNEDATRFHPLAPVNEAFMNELIEQYNVRLCELYYPPYNFERTGCKGCPFNKDIQNDLTTLYKLLPKEYYQCLHIWKPVYDEYIRIGYRLKEYPHKYLKVKNKKLF